MRRIFAIVISIVCCINTLSAQRGTLIIHGTSPTLFLVHKTVAKENYYSVGRLYNVPPKEIAAYNNLTLENGLNLGAPIKIPLTENNFIQSPVVDKNLLPVYHIVGAKEGLYRVSVNYNKVPIDLLKKWNHLSTDAVSNGTKLIVGFLKAQNESTLDVKKETVIAEEKPVVKKELPKEIPAPKNPEPVKETVKTLPANETNKTPEVKTTTENHQGNNFNGGAFKKLFDEQSLGKSPVSETGLSGIFKSTSGWKDGKYYCFHNTAAAGTIIKITNNANGKSVFAKVLDLMPDIPQNAGLSIAISNAAADELGATGNKFDCSISYSNKQ